MIEFFSHPKNVLRVSNQLLWAGAAMLLAGIAIAYGLERQLGIGALVLAHSAVIIGPSFLKIGYVMRLAGHAGLRKANWEANCAIA